MPFPGSVSSPNWVGGVFGGSCDDQRLHRGAACGPFQTGGAFSQFRVSILDVLTPNSTALAQRVREIGHILQGYNHQIVFTHGDLSSDNVIVEVREGSEDDLRVWLINWEQSGWYPEYWEYVKGFIGKGVDSPWGIFFSNPS